MKYLGHALTLIGAAMVLAGVFAQNWFIVETVSVDVTGWAINPGRAVAILALLVIASTTAAVVIRRRALIVSESLTSLFMLALCAWAYFDAHGVIDAQADWTIAVGQGFYMAILGAIIIQIGALRVFAQGPDMAPDKRPLRVALLWNGTIISEQIFDEPHDVTIGEDIRCTFTGFSLDLHEAFTPGSIHTLSRASGKEG